MGKRGPKKGAKNAGRPSKLKIDDKLLHQVEAMAGLGLTLEDISLILDISDRALRTHRLNDEKLSSAYKRGRAQGKMAATDSLRQLIRARNLGAICFYLKTQHRWTETERIEHAGEITLNDSREFIESAIARIASRSGAKKKDSGTKR